MRFIPQEFSWEYGTAAGGSPRTAEVEARTRHVMTIPHDDARFLPGGGRGLLILDQSKQGFGRLLAQCYWRGPIRSQTQ